MSTPAASTKSINSSNPEARDATNSPLQQNGDATPDQNGSNGEPEGGYPPQRHAGAIGLGPEYGKQNRVTAGDKIQGLKEQIAGKITHNPEKAEHGREMRTGELKKKEKEAEDKESPFQSVDDDEKKAKGVGNGDAGGNDDNSGGDQVAGNAAPTSVTGKRGPGTHPTEAGAQEQAATTAPEGTEKAEQQRQGENVATDRQIDESNRVGIDMIFSRPNNDSGHS